MSHWLNRANIKSHQGSCILLDLCTKPCPRSPILLTQTMTPNQVPVAHAAGLHLCCQLRVRSDTGLVHLQLFAIVKQGLDVIVILLGQTLHPSALAGTDMPGKAMLACCHLTSEAPLQSLYPNSHSWVGLGTRSKCLRRAEPCSSNVALMEPLPSLRLQTSGHEPRRCAQRTKLMSATPVSRSST